jgi:hypothetical protein
MVLYHERMEHRAGPIAAGDEEECFTARGRRTGVWFTTEAMEGEQVVSVTVADDELVDYEVTGDDGGARVFVVPVATASGWSFVPA